MPHRLIVTGAAGFIGSHLCMALVRMGARVVGVDNFDPFYDRNQKLGNVDRILRESTTACSNRPGGFELIEADICDAQAMRDLVANERPDGVFHLAAMASVRPSIANPRKYTEVNIDGLLCVLEACRAAGCRHVIFASSSSVYGNNRKVPFSEEDQVDDPISPYAATKRAGEIVCQTYARVYGLRIAALRLFTVYGPAQRPDLAIAKFMRLIDAGQDVPMFGDGSTSRDYTYIDDVIAGVLAAWEVVTGAQSAACGFAPVPNQSPPPHQGFFRIYNLGSDQPIALRDMIDAIARTVGKPARVKAMPVQPGDVQRTWADLTRSRGELGYAPTMTFPNGLSRQWPCAATSNINRRAARQRVKGAVPSSA
jgi:UDP-glucuronate 4-epimerase